MRTKCLSLGRRRLHDSLVCQEVLMYWPEDLFVSDSFENVNWMAVLLVYSRFFHNLQTIYCPVLAARLLSQACVTGARSPTLNLQVCCRPKSKLRKENSVQEVIPFSWFTKKIVPFGQMVQGWCNTNAQCIAAGKRNVLCPKCSGVTGALHTLLSTLVLPFTLLLTGASTFTQA